jgi:hypothetical protein
MRMFVMTMALVGSVAMPALAQETGTVTRTETRTESTVTTTERTVMPTTVETGANTDGSTFRRERGGESSRAETRSTVRSLGRAGTGVGNDNYCFSRRIISAGGGTQIVCDGRSRTVQNDLRVRTTSGPTRGSRAIVSPNFVEDNSRSSPFYSGNSGGTIQSPFRGNSSQRSPFRR